MKEEKSRRKEGVGEKRGVYTCAAERTVSYKRATQLHPHSALSRERMATEGNETAVRRQPHACHCQPPMDADGVCAGRMKPRTVAAASGRRSPAHRRCRGWNEGTFRDEGCKEGGVPTLSDRLGSRSWRNGAVWWRSRSPSRARGGWMEHRPRRCPGQLRQTWQVSR